MKKTWIEFGGILLTAPIFIWFLSFIADTYKIQAEVTDTKSDIQEIKSDIKYIRNYLLEKK